MVDTASLIERRRQILLNTPHLTTLSANPLTFQTDISANLKDCKIYFEPVQEGSGDPSPDNVRPISGWDGVELHINNTSLTLPFPKTIYGGYVDLVKGVLVETHHKEDIPSSSVSLNANKTTHLWVQMSLTSYGKPLGSVMCNRLASLHYGDAGLEWSISCSSTGNRFIMNVPVSNDIADINDVKAWIDDNPIYGIYELATPITHQLTPQVIKTLKGINNIWSDANGNIELRFWKH